MLWTWTASHCLVMILNTEHCFAIGRIKKMTDTPGYLIHSPMQGTKKFSGAQIFVSGTLLIKFWHPCSSQLKLASGPPKVKESGPLHVCAYHGSFNGSSISWIDIPIQARIWTCNHHSWEFYSFNFGLELENQSKKIGSNLETSSTIFIGTCKGSNSVPCLSPPNLQAQVMCGNPIGKSWRWWQSEDSDTIPYPRNWRSWIEVWRGRYQVRHMQGSKCFHLGSLVKLQAQVMCGHPMSKSW